MQNSQNVKQPSLNAAERKQNRTLRSLGQDELCRHTVWVKQVQTDILCYAVIFVVVVWQKSLDGL